MEAHDVKHSFGVYSVGSLSGSGRFPTREEAIERARKILKTSPNSVLAITETIAVVTADAPPITIRELR